MENINKEFRFFTNNNDETQPNSKGLYIVKSQPTLTIDRNGNIIPTDSKKFCIGTGDGWYYGKTKDYFGIKHINDDHYAVIDIESVIQTEESKSALNSKFELKFGIIQLQRNDYKQVINTGEKIIAPIIYDRIYVYDDTYPILEINGRYTYFCLDKESKNYRHQLVPVILEAACPFNIKYKGFAECTIHGKTRFLPIDFIAAEAITEDDLLTEEEVISLINSYKGFKKLQRITNSKIPQLIENLQ